MNTLGLWLRQAREAKGSTLAEAEIDTRIRARFLEALESGDFAAFPGGDVQVRGFLRIYARYLGLPPDQVLARYDAEVHGVEVAPPAAPAEVAPSAPPASAPTRPMTFAPSSAPTRPMTSTSPSVPVSASRPRWLTLDRLLIGGIGLIVVLAIAAGGRYLWTHRGEGKTAAPLATTKSTGASLSPSPTVTQTLVAATPAFPASPQGGVTLTLEATEHVWARVSTDGSKVFEGMLAVGQNRTWSGQEVIVVETGNGAGLQVTVNGQPQGRMCGRAEVCRRGWGPTGEVLVP